MRYLPVSLLLLLATAPLSRAAANDLCFTAGTTTYRLSQSAAADYRIKIASGQGAADLRMQIVDQAEIADFIIADDSDIAADPCKSNGHVATVRADANEPRPDVTVALSREMADADYRIYVRSARYVPQDAAAFLAAMWKSAQRRIVAERR